MSFLVLEAYLKLIHFDLFLRRRHFFRLHQKIRDYPIHEGIHRYAAGEVCAAVDSACIWYWKRVLCLQRSAVLACLLKRYGIAAQMVIGAQQMPFKAHAWVEVNGQVVNDKPYVGEIYATLDHC